MNKVELIHLWNNEYALTINGKNFAIYSEIIGYTKKCNPKYRYFVRIAPEYNPSGKQNIYAKNITELTKKVENLDFVISTIQGYFR